MAETSTPVFPNLRRSIENLLKTRAGFWAGSLDCPAQPDLLRFCKCWRFQALLMPDSRNSAKLIKHVPAVVETHLCNFTQSTCILELFTTQFVVIAPSLLKIPQLTGTYDT